MFVSNCVGLERDDVATHRVDFLPLGRWRAIQGVLFVERRGTEIVGRRILVEEMIWITRHVVCVHVSFGFIVLCVQLIPMHDGISICFGPERIVPKH